MESHLAAAAGGRPLGVDLGRPDTGPRTRFDRLVLAVDAGGELRGLARRSSAEVDAGIAALGSCVDVS